MLSYLRKTFSSDNSNRKKSRKKSRNKSNKLKASSSGRKLLNKTLSSFSDVLSSVENIPHNIDVAQWILGVETPPAFNTGYRPISPPVPVRSSSRLAVSPQNIPALKNLLHSNGYSSPKMYATEKKSKQISKLVNVNNSSKDKSKTKSSKVTGHKQSKSAPKIDKTISKSKRTQPRNKSVSPQLKSGERYGWQYINVMLNRVPTYGLGIAVGGGRDNPHFIDGDPSIVVSDILKAGPADGKLKINDRVISVNGISLENVDYNSAVHVLRESGNSVNLLIKRRVVMQNKPNDTFRVTLTKNKRKDDFGVVLGCKLFVKEITNRKLIEKNTPIQEGDLVLKLNHAITDDLSLKEVKKLVESGKNKLRLVIKRELNNNRNNNTFNELSQSPRMSPNANLYDNLSAINNIRSNWTNQNIYAQTPLNTKGKQIDDKNNLNRLQQQQQLLQQQLGEYARNSEPPVNDMHYSQFNQTVTPPTLTAHSKTASFPADNITPPPRPPPPRPLRPMNVAENEQQPQQIFSNQHEIKPVSTEPRLVSFQKDSNGFGIRLTGGNQSGIFVSAVKPSSLAILHGLQVGDKVLKINNTNMNGKTREEAVTLLYSIEKQIYLIVQHIKEEYNDVIANRRSDSFYVRVYFNYDTTVKGEIAFRSGEVFHVIDTVYNDCIGLWLAWRLTRITNQEIEIGVIPNQTRAEKYATNAVKNKKYNSDTNENTSNTRGGIFRRSLRKVESNNAEQQSTYEMSEVFLAYERVLLKQPNFIRPVVIFGPIADMAREKLVKDYPDCYELPRIHSNDLKVKKEESNISLSAIKEVIHKAKHALLTITPNDVHRLNYEQLYPIVILLTAQNKMIVKELRADLPKSMRKNSRKLFDDAVECEKLWSHVFTATITVKSSDDMWYDTLRETIEMQQLSSIWMSEFKCKKDFTDDDDTLFPIMSSSSFAASRENSDNDIIGNLKYVDKDAVYLREMVNESIKALSIPSDDKSKLKLAAAYDKIDRERDRDREQLLYYRSPIDDYSRLTFQDMYSSADERNQNTVEKKFTNKVVELPPSVDRISKPTRFRRDTQNFFEYREVEKPTKYSGLSHASSSSQHNYIPITSKPTVQRDINGNIYGNCFSYVNDYSDFGINYKQRYDSVVKQLNPSAKYVEQIQSRDTPPPLPPPPIILSPPSPKMFNYYPVAMSANRRHVQPIKHYGIQEISDDSDDPIVSGMNELQLNQSFGYFVSANKVQPQSVSNACDDLSFKDSNNAIYSYSTFRPNMSNESVCNQTFDDSKHNVIATAKGVFNSSGGVLISDKTEVCLVIPENAIPEGMEQEIYFKVCRDTSMAPPLDQEKGETLLSPIVMCGPHGLQFERPVELRLPHCVSGNADRWSFALKSSDSTNGMQWQNVNLETKDGKQSANSVVDNNFISVLVDHF